MFRKHRLAFLDQMQSGDIALFPGASHVIRNHDVEFPFRQNSDFAYLTNFHEADACLLFAKDIPDIPEETLFVLPKDPLKETWTGRRVGPEGAVEKFGIASAENLDALEEKLRAAMASAGRMWFRMGAFPQTEALVVRLVNDLRMKIRMGIEPPLAFLDPGAALHEQRLFKSEEELGWMRKAAAISAEAHLLAMAQAKPGMKEYELDALLSFTFRRHGGQGAGWSYPSIVAGGDNANILHYTQNDVELKDGDLVLIDAGAELNGYAADITRTFPVNGIFSSAQKEVYEVVLSALEASIQECKTGAPFHGIHQAALSVLCDGLRQLKITKDSVEEMLEKETYRSWYMHNTSHWIGRDVHDAGRYKVDGASRPLEPGMCLTVEPGLYFSAADEAIPEAFRGIGIRIEDDIHITGGEPEILTSATVKTIADVEEACASERLAPPMLETERVTS